MGQDKDLQSRVESEMMEMWAKNESKELWDLACLVYAAIEVISGRTLVPGNTVPDPANELTPMDLDAPVPDSFGPAIDTMEVDADPWSGLI